MSTYSIFWRWDVGGRLLTFSAFMMGAYSRLGGYSNKYDIGHATRQDWYESNEYESKY